MMLTAHLEDKSEKVLSRDLLAGESIGNNGGGLIVKDRHHNIASSDCQQSSAPQLNLHGHSDKIWGQSMCPNYWIKGIKHSSIPCAIIKQTPSLMLLEYAEFHCEVRTEAKTGAVSLNL